MGRCRPGAHPHAGRCLWDRAFRAPGLTPSVRQVSENRCTRRRASTLRGCGDRRRESHDPGAAKGACEDGPDEASPKEKGGADHPDGGLVRSRVQRRTGDQRPHARSEPLTALRRAHHRLRRGEGDVGTDGKAQARCGLGTDADLAAAALRERMPGIAHPNPPASFPSSSGSRRPGRAPRASLASTPLYDDRDVDLGGCRARPSAEDPRR